ncbi:MAG TPA: hypothetical protein VFA65_23025 [Bryobacteraceae bacterium]|nr:hypothetical protein [Bryobacteraceae bacterium]
MTDKTISLDQHRGMAAQKATGIRRLLAEVKANENFTARTPQRACLRLVAAPAATWEEAAEKARYLISLFAATSAADDPWQKKLIAAALDDFAPFALCGK